MMKKPCLPVPSVAAALLLILWLVRAPLAFSEELHSYAFVRDDASLRISNTTVHLYGIHIPDAGSDCHFFMRPVVCAPRAALALEFKIQGFVRCEIIERHPDRSVTGRCYNDEEDLSLYLLRHGWALALPGAPFEYHAQERIARHRNLGVWGFPVDNLRQAPSLRSDH